jgi:hypothetical protein
LVAPPPSAAVVSGVVAGRSSIARRCLLTLVEFDA